MESYAGRFVRISLDDGGIYDGYVHSWNAQSGQITLQKVVLIEDDERKPLQGLLHFYADEIQSIVATEDVIKNKKTSHVQKKEKGRSIMRGKCNTKHLDNLHFFDPTSMVLKNWTTEKDGLNSSGNEEGSSDQESTAISYAGCTILDKFDSHFSEAVRCIQEQVIIGVSLEGVAIGRCGQLCWLQISIRDHVFMFDILKLGKSCFEKALTAILENEDILKVIHDCRMVSDILHHQFNTKLVNVFDTQVASVMVYRIYHNHDWPRYVEALTSCLVHHLKLPNEEVNWALVRERNREVDEEVWKIRPIKLHLVDAAVKNIKHLLALHHVLMEKIMGEFVAGVNIYLCHVKDASDSDSVRYQSSSHLLPIAFQNLSSFLPSYSDNGWRNPYLACRQQDKDINGFRDNCSGIIQPNVNFSRDSLWHTGNTSPAGNKMLVQSCLHEKPLQPSPDSRVTSPLGQKESTASSVLLSTSAAEATLLKPHLLGSPGATAINSCLNKNGEMPETHSDSEVPKLTGTSLMRALINQQSGSQSNQSNLDNLKFVPAGTTVKNETKPPKQQRSAPRSSKTNDSRGTGSSYNFVRQNVLSQQEIDLGEKLRKSLTSSRSESSLKNHYNSCSNFVTPVSKPKSATSTPADSEFVSLNNDGANSVSKSTSDQSSDENCINQPVLSKLSMFRKTQALLERQSQGISDDSRKTLQHSGRGETEKQAAESLFPTQPVDISSSVSPPQKPPSRMQRLLEALHRQNLS